MSFTEKPLSVEANGTRIPAVLSLPSEGVPAHGFGAENAPAPSPAPTWGIVIVPGSFPNDVDGNYLPEMGNPFTAKPHAYKDLAQQLAARGFAVLRYARGGVTVLDKEKAEAHRRFADRTTVVAEAIRMLRAIVPGLKHIALAGHSEGGPVALLLMTRDKALKIDAYISLSAPARRMFDIMLQQTEKTVRDGMASFGPQTFPFAAYKKAMDLTRKGEPVPAELLKVLPPFGVYAMDEASKRYLRDYDEVDSRILIAEVPCPVLIVQGGNDTSVYPDNAEMLWEARKKSPAQTERVYFPELQHFYKVIAPGTDPMAAFGLETESDVRVAEAIKDFLRPLVLSPRL
jgi:alpha-beta hydrolase superfamily lysophospholipase